MNVNRVYDMVQCNVYCVSSRSIHEYIYCNIIYIYYYIYYYI